MLVFNGLRSSTARHGEGLALLRVNGGQFRARFERVLRVGNDVTSFRPRGGFLQASLYGEQHFVVIVGFEGIRQFHHGGLARSDGWEVKGAVFNSMAVLQNGVLQLEVVERQESIAILHGEALCSCVVVIELHILVDLLDLGEFRRPGAVGSDDAVVDKVELVGARVVETASKLVETIDGGLA